MSEAPRDFMLDEVNSLRTELQERNRAVNKLVLSAVAGSFTLLAFALKEGIGEKVATPVGGVVWGVICAALPAVVMPILTLWFSSEVHSAHRIALFIRRVSEPALASSQELSDAMSWEQFTGTWGALKQKVKECEGRKEKDPEKACNAYKEGKLKGQHRCQKCSWIHVELKLLANPKGLALQVMTVISLGTAILVAWLTNFDKSRATLLGMLIAWLAALLLTRVLSVYPNMREMHGIRNIQPNCRHWNDIRTEVLSAARIHRDPRPSEARLNSPTG